MKINVDGREITLDKVESLLKGVGSGKINGHEFKEKYNNTVDDVKRHWISQCLQKVKKIW